MPFYSEFSGVSLTECRDYLFKDTSKACQSLLSQFQIELIEKNEFIEYLHSKNLSLQQTNLKIDLNDLEKLILSYQENTTFSLLHKFNKQKSLHTPYEEDQNIIKILTIRSQEGSKSSQYFPLLFLLFVSMIFLSFRVVKICNSID
jgi:ATP-dependent Zn protease